MENDRLVKKHQTKNGGTTMTDKEIIKELYDALLWYESEENKLLEQAKEYRRQIDRNKRLIQCLQDKIKEEQQ